MTVCALRLAYAGLNLKRNPFGVLGLEEAAGLAVAVPEIPLLAPGRALQIVGKEGRGKTTQLLRLAGQHQGAVYHKVAPGQAEVPLGWTLPGTLLIDEAQHLSSPFLLRLLRRVGRSGGRLALASHHDLRPRVGALENRIDTGVLAGLDLERLRSIVARRIEAARRGPGLVPTVPDEVLVRLIESHGDDLRAIGFELYDAFQQQEELGPVQL